MIEISKLNGTDHPSFYIGVLTSLREFDSREIEGVLSGLLGITKREECFYALYLRAQRNVDTLLELKHVAHFQAIAMLSRAIFELRMDIEMLAKMTDGEEAGFDQLLREEGEVRTLVGLGGDGPDIALVRVPSGLSSRL